MLAVISGRGGSGLNANSFPSAPGSDCLSNYRRPLTP